MKEEPFEFLTYVLRNGKLFATRAKSYSFDKKAERDYFASSKKDCFHQNLWHISKGKKGNRFTEYHVTIHYLRDEKESS